MNSTALRDRIIAFVRDASIEATPHDAGRLPEIAASLQPGTTVYVAHPPRWQLADVIRVAIRIRGLGFPVRPHVVARALPDERALRNALSQLSAAGIDQILLVAGDAPTPAGTFGGTLDVLASGATVDCGMKTVAVAGHPEGHRLVPSDVLWDALLAKQAFAERTGTRIEVVTQFGFDAQAIADWLRGCRERGIVLPARFGIAGPTPPAKLLRFAVQCGVGAALRGLLGGNALALSGLAGITTTPEEMVTKLAAMTTAVAGETSEKPHFFCFGGTLETARWLRKVAGGAFDLRDDLSRFAVRD